MPPVRPSSRRPSSPPGPVLLLTRDQALADHVQALADAAGVPLAVRPAVPVPAGDPPLILLGLDIVPDLPRGRRGGVLVVRVEGTDPPDDVWRRAVDAGVDEVALLPEAEARLIDTLADAGPAAARAPVIGVLPGSGGAGASTLAVALAVSAAQRGHEPVLIDTDALGGGLDLALGLEAVAGLRWSDAPPGPGRWPPGLVTASLPQVAGVRVLTGSRSEPVPVRPAVAAAAVDAASREGGLVVVDLARHADQVGAAVLPRCQWTFLVALPQVRAAAAAAQVAAAVSLLAPNLGLVVRQPSLPAPPVGDLADALQLPLLARMAPDRRAALAIEQGEAAVLPGRGPLAQVCRELLASIEEPW